LRADHLYGWLHGKRNRLAKAQERGAYFAAALKIIRHTPSWRRRAWRGKCAVATVEHGDV
jgi:hypothetical protein